MSDEFSSSSEDEDEGQLYVFLPAKAKISRIEQNRKPLILRVQMLGANASPAMGDYNASNTFTSNEDHNAGGALTTSSTLADVQTCIYNNLRARSKEFATGGRCM